MIQVGLHILINIPHNMVEVEVVVILVDIMEVITNHREVVLILSGVSHSRAVELDKEMMVDKDITLVVLPVEVAVAEQVLMVLMRLLLEAIRVKAEVLVEEVVLVVKAGQTVFVLILHNGMQAAVEVAVVIQVEIVVNQLVDKVVVVTQEVHLELQMVM